MIKQRLFLFLAKILPAQKIYAHCDVPCGIYDLKPAQIAAATILKMTQLIDDLPFPENQDKNKMITYHNSLVRYILTKEEHARKCKEEILIIWTDYFKEEHLIKFPQLHETFWKAAKLCSKVKQEVNLQLAEELVKTVDQIVDIFQKTKTAQKK